MKPANWLEIIFSAKKWRRVQSAKVFIIRGCKMLFFKFKSAKYQKHVIQECKLPITQWNLGMATGWVLPAPALLGPVGTRPVGKPVKNIFWIKKSSIYFFCTIPCFLWIIHCRKIKNKENQMQHIISFLLSVVYYNEKLD